MALRLAQKQELVAEVTNVADKALSVVVAEYAGLPVAKVTDLRTQANKAGVHLQVVRNTLAKRALRGTSFECLLPALKGPVMLAFSMEEVSASARLLKDFAKENEKLVVTALSIGNELLDRSQLDKVAKLPTKDEALAMLLCVMQAPIAKFVRTLQAPHLKLVRTFVALRDKMQSES
ncbi:MAG: ribosomal protein [Pseudomonadota bacterium]